MSNPDVRQLIEAVETEEELQALFDEVPEALDMAVEMIMEAQRDKRQEVA
jgi:hypothetical protein